LMVDIWVFVRRMEVGRMVYCCLLLRVGGSPFRGLGGVGKGVDWLIGQFVNWSLLLVAG